MEYFYNSKYHLIYIIRLPYESHHGLVKIGDTSISTLNLALKPNCTELNEAARKRVKEYTQTAGINFDLLHTELAVYQDAEGLKGFDDHAVHDVLIRSGIKRKHFGKDIKSDEWFCCDLETAKRAIAAVKEGRKALKGSELHDGLSEIQFRPEQREAIDKTLKQFRDGNQMLWNAKMRFGKTLSALQVVKERGLLAEQENWAPFRRVLILTHRPVVDAGWFEDFGKIFFDSDEYEYGSKTNGETFLSLENRARREECRYIYFASMQDLRGSEIVGGNFDKNSRIFSNPWDLIIVDEAHEGTQTELGKAVMKELTKENTKVLRLSGTPFNLLDDFNEDEIYTWDYVMEQRAKAQWDIEHPGDHNPYAGLPRLNIYTYDLGKLMHEYADEDIAFNFREFFRTNDNGDFVHEKHVQNFLDLLSKNDEESMYPFANKRYREIFRHTLWMVPGVKSAKSLSKLLNNHPVFGKFKIVNVAGDGDEEEANEEALKKVTDAIGPDPDKTRTITLSCGRLTTGVSVKPWMGVFMLAGSFNTAASVYMQTIFRVQTPATINGRVKEDCYVFDFAPDRTLKVLAETAKVSTKAGKQSSGVRQQLGEFLNFCPIISIEGSQMKELNTEHMLQQLKRVYVERVVQHGFEDGYLYNDELMRLTDVDIKEFDKLKGIIGQTKAMAKTNDITINEQGLTNEEYEEKEKLEKKKKKKRELTDEENARLEELKKKKKVKEDAISILRGISIRMPLMIYGAKVENEDEELTIDNFTQLVDAQSWEEFMPKGVTKQRFNAFKKYYDPDIFTAAAKRIRQMARAADRLSIEERIERIAAIFATFRNPDKETVLTPWRVVNMHMSDCLGGYTFYNEDFSETIEEPRFVDRGDVTADVFTPDSHLLEINSKSGLYPLYLAYNIYRARLRDEMFSPETLEEHQAIWDAAIAKNIFVICKTPMAKYITRRTLLGFRKGKTNMWAPEDLINKIKNQPELFIKKVGDLVGKNVKIKAVVGNPPYQVMDGGGTGSSAVPVYNNFVTVSQSVKPDYISMIMPAKWYSGGRGLDEFRQEMLNDTRIRKLVDFVDSRDVFPTVDIAGGICYFLWDTDYDDDCTVVNISNGKTSSEKRLLNAFDTFIRDSRIIEVIKKAMPQTSSPSLAQKVYSRKPFGLRSFDKGFPAKPGRNIRLFGSGGISYLSESDVPQNLALAPKWKVIMSKASAEHAGQTDKDGRKRIVSRLEILEPGTICTESYLLLDVFDSEEDARNMHKYMRTQFVRFLIGAILLTQNIVRDKFRFVPIQDFTAGSDIDWSKSVAEIDAQLYAKYNLSDEEITFIESMIKPM